MELRFSWINGHVVARVQGLAAVDALSAAVPAHLCANRWGDMLYLPLALDIRPAGDALSVVVPGTLAYWQEGKSVVIVFGQTPLSKEGECRLPAPMQILGRMEGSLASLHSIGTADRVELSLK